MKLVKTKKIKIGYKVYSLIDNTKVLDGLKLSGRHSNLYHLIEYSSNYPASEVVDTLIHEMLHACWDLHVTNEHTEEEAVVTGLAHGLTQVFKDNPKLVQEMQDLLK